MQLNWFKKQHKKLRVYLDNAAATPINESVLALIHKTSAEVYANASAIHTEGVIAREMLEEARLKLARLLKVRPKGIVFTGSGTESNNLAIYGLLRHLYESGKKFSEMTVLSTEIEHPSVSEVLNHLGDLGVQIKYLRLDEEGRIDLKDLQSALDESVVLVTFAYVNSELGVIQEVGKISRIIKKYNTENTTDIKLHVDAAQAPLWLPCQFDFLGVDLLSLDAGKCHGPKGVGVLAMRYGVELKPVILGGGQEHGLRSATENVPALVGAVESMLIAQDDFEKRAEKVTKLRDYLVTELNKIDGVILNGSKEHRVANNVNVSVNGIDGEFAVVSLDEAGFAVSTKSACSGAGGGGSKVVKVIYGDEDRSKTTIRISLSEYTTKSDLDRFIEAFSSHVTKVRKHQAEFSL